MISDPDLRYFLRQLMWLGVGALAGLFVLGAVYLLIPLEEVGPFAAAGLAMLCPVTALGVYGLLAWRDDR